MSPAALYLDASAIVKLVVRETESAALDAYLSLRPTQLTSRLSAVEVPRAAARHGDHDPARLAQVLEQLSYVELDLSLVATAASLGPTALRTLDAIHLASALALGTDLAGLVTYDTRLANAALEAGLPVVAPA